MEEIKVYIKIDENKIIKDINSSIFLDSIDGYIEIDSGFGDNYSHAQSNYLGNSITDTKGKYNYKYQDNAIVELTDDEKEILFPKQEIVPGENPLD